MMTRIAVAAVLGGFFATGTMTPSRLQDSSWVVDRATLPSSQSPSATSLPLVRGIAYRRDWTLRDGTIEFQISPPGSVHAGVAFRMASTADYEIVYFSASDDGTRWRAMQYQPVFAGETTWQLYYREGYRAVIPAEISGALRVRLVFSGTRADVYLNGGRTPLLQVHDLKRDPASGSVGFWTTSPATVTTATVFSGIATSASVPILDPLPAETAPDTQLMRWHVSPRYPSPGQVDPPLEPPAVDVDRWPVVQAEASGLVNLTRAIGNPAGPQSVNVFGGAGWGLAYAHVSIDAAVARHARLFVAYSDGIGVYLNGERRYAGYNLDPGRSPDANGSVNGEMDAVDLPLRAGRNDLVLAITDRAFGWGFKARLDALTGLTIRP
jgi:hypothetical protein